MSSCSAQTSGCVQFRSGCSGANRWRYHSPGTPTSRCASRPGRRRSTATRSAAAPRRPRAGPEPEALALGRSGRRGEGRPEPRVLVRDVVRDDVHDRADPERARLGDQLLGLCERPEGGVDRPVVRDVVAGVRQRGRVPRVEPERVDAELAQVRAAAREHPRGRRFRRRSRRRSCGRRPGRRPPRATTGVGPAASRAGRRRRAQVAAARVAVPSGVIAGEYGTIRQTNARALTKKCKISCFECKFRRSCAGNRSGERSQAAWRADRAAAVEPRATISGSKNSSSGETAEPSIWPASISTAARPIASIGWRTVVSGGPCSS